jgi:transcription elongation factor Elf1
MSTTWQGKTKCRKCAAPLLVSLEPGESDGSGLAVFYCPACGDRSQVEIPDGYDPLSAVVTPDV